ncbi:hypothetical protein ACA910_003925 [Epithemia clementina (nom. ined.)]
MAGILRREGLLIKPSSLKGVTAMADVGLQVANEEHPDLVEGHGRAHAVFNVVCQGGIKRFQQGLDGGFVVGTIIVIIECFLGLG